MKVGDLVRHKFGIDGIGVLMQRVDSTWVEPNTGKIQSSWIVLWNGEAFTIEERWLEPA